MEAGVPSFEALAERMRVRDPAQLSPLYPDVDDLWEVTRELGLEGVVAKRRASTYQPGRRSPDWVKATHRSTRTALA
jgi:bifunctional non-homologous end joining protein LigD